MVRSMRQGTDVDVGQGLCQREDGQEPGADSSVTPHVPPPDSADGLDARVPQGSA